jgi:hypothetical protein
MTLAASGACDMVDELRWTIGRLQVGYQPAVRASSRWRGRCRASVGAGAPRRPRAGGSDGEDFDDVPPRATGAYIIEATPARRTISERSTSAPPRRGSRAAR